MIGLIAGTLMLTAFIAPYARDIPDRIRNARDGIRGIAYTPIVWIAMLPAAITAHRAAEHVPVLNWGWAGHNILVTPLITDDTTTGTGTDATGTVIHPVLAHPAVEIVLVTAFFFTLIAAFLVFNYDEETWGRETWWHVAGWAAAHLIMGIPIFAIIPIFAAGIVFKLVHDRHDRNTAFAAHLANNTCIAAALAAILIIT